MGDIVLIFQYPIPVLYEKQYIINKNRVNSTMIEQYHLSKLKYISHKIKIY